MKKNKNTWGILIILLIVLILIVGVIYYFSQKDKNDDNVITSQEEETQSFFATVAVVEENSIEVIPYLNTEVSKVAEKITINFDDSSDIVYNIDDNLKITVFGSVTSNVIENDAVKEIDIKSADSIILDYNIESNTNLTPLLERNDNLKYGAYTYSGTFSITLDNYSMDLQVALQRNKIKVNELVDKAENDVKEGIASKDSSNENIVIYDYENYRIIKNDVTDDTYDIYLGPKTMTIDVIKNSILK